MSETQKAYKQGVRDAKAGRSINSPRYADKAKDQAWLRGMLAELRRRKK